MTKDCCVSVFYISVFRCGVLLKTIENEMFKNAITKKRRDEILNNETEWILYEMLKKKLIHYTLLLWLHRKLFTRKLIEINLPYNSPPDAPTQPPASTKW